MRGRASKALDVPLTNGTRGAPLSLADFVSAGRICVSGKFTGKLKIQTAMDGGRDDSSWRDVGSEHTGTGATFYYNEAAGVADVLLVAVLCTADITNVGGPPLDAPVQVRFVGTVR